MTSKNIPNVKLGAYEKFNDIDKKKTIDSLNLLDILIRAGIEVYVKSLNDEENDN